MSSTGGVLHSSTKVDNNNEVPNTGYDRKLRIMFILNGSHKQCKRYLFYTYRSGSENLDKKNDIFQLCVNIALLAGILERYYINILLIFGVIWNFIVGFARFIKEICIPCFHYFLPSLSLKRSISNLLEKPDKSNGTFNLPSFVGFSYIQ